MSIYDVRKPGLLFRLKIALKVLKWKPFQIQYNGFYYVTPIRPNIQVECDNLDRTGCKNVARQALAYDVVALLLEQQDWYHLCDSCAKDALGTKDKLPYLFEKNIAGSITISNEDTQAKTAAQ